MMPDKGFIWNEGHEPYFERRKELLKEVKELLGVDKSLKFNSLFVIIMHPHGVYFVTEEGQEMYSYL